MLGQLLLSWREAANMTQTQAQIALGYRSSGTISLHESGQAAPSAAMVRRYADLYGRPREDLMYALLLLAGVDSSGEADLGNPSAIAPRGEEVAL